MNKLIIFRAPPIRTVWMFLRRVQILVILGAILMTSCTLPNFTGGPTPVLFQSTTALPTQTQDQAANLPEQSTTSAKESPTSTVTPLSDTEPFPVDLTGFDNKALNDLIVFTSLSGAPFANTNLGKIDLLAPERRMWAISPDGLRAGRLSSTSQGTALYLSRNEQGPIKFIDNGVNLSHPGLEPVALPEECAPASGNACSEFSFGPEGRTLAYFTSVDNCGRNLSLVDLLLNQTINTWSHVHWYKFLLDGSLILSLDDCSGNPRNIYLYIPNKNTQAGLGQEGIMLWNPSQQAALVQVQDQLPVFSGLWGLNLQTSRVFLWMEREQRVIDDSPVWLADGRHFLYQHRPIQFYANSTTIVLGGPRQIILMDAGSRDQRLLAYDGRYDYHLCESTGVPCEMHYGDWLKIRRTAFKALRISLDETDLPEARCALYGLDCKQQVEEMALNWKTGEMLPWSEAGVTEVEPTPAFPLPDLAVQPVYSDPSGSYAFYTGPGGRTLWYVPAAGDPILWVTEGENFVYLP